jgi:type I restriction enzyme R subunit
VSSFTESVVEEAALAWLESLGYSIKQGPDISPGGDTLTLALSQWERESYSEVILSTQLREALVRLNPMLPVEATEDAFRKISRLEGATLDTRNRVFHRLLVDGVTVEFRSDGAIRGAQARLVDFNNLENNDWLAVNQFTVVENKHNRRPDIVIFVNGLPLAVIELKNAADEDATIWDAYQQLQTYQAEVQSLFAYNETLVVSDGVQASIGALGAGREWFKPWRTITGETLAETYLPELQVMIQGVFDKRRFLDLIRYFVVFEDFGGGAVGKKIAGYHQFHAVNIAVEEKLCARRACGRRQRSGASRRVSTARPSNREGGRATGGSVLSGTPKARASRSRWPSTPGE